MEKESRDYSNGLQSFLDPSFVQQFHKNGVKTIAFLRYNVIKNSHESKTYKRFCSKFNLLAVKSSFPVLFEGNKIAVNLKLTIEATIGMKMDAVVTLLLNSKILEK